MNNLMGQDLDDLDHNNADLKHQEKVINGLFGNDQQDDDIEEQSPDGIENVDISDIQKMINKSSESPGLEQVDQEMLEGMDFMNQMSSPEQNQIDFYNNMQKIKNENNGAVGAALDDYYDEEDQDLDDLNSDQMMKMIEKQQQLDHHEAQFSHMLAGDNELSGIDPKGSP